MSREYTVYGDYGYVTETELYRTVSLKSAIQWAERYCNRDGMGGYSVIEVAYHADDGEYITEWVCRSEEDYLIDEY